MKRFCIKPILWTLGGMAGFVALYLGAAWCCSRIAIPAEAAAPQEVTIFIKSNGAHTDIVLPVRSGTTDWRLKLPCSNNVSPDTLYNWVAIGWGDKGFFIDMPTWDDLTLGLAFRAAFWLGSSAMHVTYYKEVYVNDLCRRTMISREQYARLVEFIEGRFRRAPDGSFINIETDAAYGLSDAFYEARGRYNLFYSCNTWANDALAACGQRHCLWTLFDKGIFLKYK
ncbi:MAG: TIGR02117 family protein [Rikenellaceae bacterium]|jgi:uncharacterized protein (TIGR02117 family)|nr:TIGR02117 family protein [Rikenellaceae bacterium]